MLNCTLALKVERHFRTTATIDLQREQGCSRSCKDQGPEPKCRKCACISQEFQTTQGIHIWGYINKQTNFSLTEVQELRERYSAIVMEQKKKIELTAKRVGLELPKEYQPDVQDAATNRVLNAFQK